MSQMARRSLQGYLRQATRRLRAMVVLQEPETPAQEAEPAKREANCSHDRPVRLSRAMAKSTERMFECELEHCPNCVGDLKFIAEILEQPVIEKSLTHLSLKGLAPPCAPARGQVLQAA
jgi:hypothetical protein